MSGRVPSDADGLMPAADAGPERRDGLLTIATLLCFGTLCVAAPGLLRQVTCHTNYTFGINCCDMAATCQLACSPPLLISDLPAVTWMQLYHC